MTHPDAFRPMRPLTNRLGPDIVATAPLSRDAIDGKDREAIRVLVVDDEQEAFLVARHLLTRSLSDRYVVEWAATLDDGLRRLTSNEHDAALVDFRLRDGDGLELIGRAAAAGSRVPMIVLTGRALDGIEIEALNAGAVDYLDKAELSEALLQRAVRLAIQRARIAVELRKSEELHAAVVEALNEGVLVVGDDGRIAAANASAIRILDTHAGHLVGRHVNDLGFETVDDTGEPFASGRWPVHVTLDTGRPMRSVLMGLRARDRGDRWILINTSPLWEGQGTRPSAVVVSFADVTATRRLEDDLRQAQKLDAIGRLAGGVAHDFNNLLTAISGYSALVLEDLPADDPHRAEVTEIARAAANAATLTRKLLAFGRRQLLRPRVVDPVEVVGEAASMLRRLIGDDIMLTIDTSRCSRSVRVDPSELEHALLNLAANARDAMPDGGQLTITVADAVIPDADGDNGQAPADPRALEWDGSDVSRGASGVPAGVYVQIDVTDTGTGMDAATLSHAFEPFFTTKEPGRGTGLGLASVYGAITQSQGHVSLSTRVGAGTTVHMLLPATTDTPERAADAESPDAPSGHERILLVEDESGIRSLVMTVLVRAGYRVDAVADGEAAIALAAAAAPRFDLLIADLILPGLRGTEVHDHLASIGRGLPVVYMSGFADRMTTAVALATPGSAFIAKPFVPADLLAIVRQTLDASGGGESP